MHMGPRDYQQDAIELFKRECRHIVRNIRDDDHHDDAHRTCDMYVARMLMQLVLQIQPQPRI